eukprot:gene20216-24181_t
MWHTIHYGNANGTHSHGIHELIKKATANLMPVKEADPPTPTPPVGGAGGLAAAAANFVGKQVLKGLNISDQYASGIQGFEGCRELVQNWIDQCERLCIQQHGGAATLMVPTISISTSKRERVVVLSANHVCYGYLMEWSNGYERFIQLTNFGTANKGAAAAGGFGEGMKVEINRLTKRGVRVKYVHGQNLYGKATCLCSLACWLCF